MELKKSWFEKYKSILSRMDKQKWTVCILLGVLLLVIALPLDTGNTAKEKKAEDTETVSDGSYEQQMEKRLKHLIEQMDGVGDVEVMIILEDEGESVVEKDVSRESSQGNKGEEKTTASSSETTTVFSGEEPYETKVITPEIRGSCIVAQGAGDDEVRVKIYQAVQALFSIEAHKISIVEMGAQEGK